MVARSLLVLVEALEVQSMKVHHTALRPCPAVVLEEQNIAAMEIDQVVVPEVVQNPRLVFCLREVSSSHLLDSEKMPASARDEAQGHYSPLSCF